MLLFLGQEGRSKDIQVFPGEILSLGKVLKFLGTHGGVIKKGIQT